MIIKYSDNNENRIYWQHRRGGEWKTAELHELIEAYEREKTGKWLYYLDNGRRRCKCSNCLTSYGCLDTPYCPNCGARMIQNE